jgi:hypothetical protein
VIFYPLRDYWPSGNKLHVRGKNTRAPQKKNTVYLVIQTKAMSQPFIFSNERNHSLTHYSNVHTSGFIGNRTNFLRHNFLLLSSPLLLIFINYFIYIFWSSLLTVSNALHDNTPHLRQAQQHGSYKTPKIKIKQ